MLLRNESPQRSCDYLEGQASMAAEVAAAKRSQEAAEHNEARWKRKHASAARALLCAAAVNALLAILLVILWLLSRRG